MLARAVNCLNQPSSDGLPDFCGQCANCTRIGEAENLEHARAFLEVAANFVGLVQDEKAAQIVRRRAAAAF